MGWLTRITQHADITEMQSIVSACKGAAAQERHIQSYCMLVAVTNKKTLQKVRFHALCNQLAGQTRGFTHNAWTPHMQDQILASMEIVVLTKQGIFHSRV